MLQGLLGLCHHLYLAQLDIKLELARKILTLVYSHPQVCDSYHQAKARKILTLVYSHTQVCYSYHQARASQEDSHSSLLTPSGLL